MRRAGPQRRVRAALVALLCCACRTAPRPAHPAETARRDGGAAEAPPVFSSTPQPGSVIAEVDGIAVLALAAPQFAQLPRDQRLVAYFTARAGALGHPVALDQSWRHNLAIARILRGILSRPAAVQAPLFDRIRRFARLVWLNGGVHDAESGRKEAPPFTLADLRGAALAAQAAGADLGVGSLSLEYALRALDGPLFDPRVDPVRTAHGQDLTASAVNLYAAVTSKDLHGLREKYALNSRLARDDAFIVEQVIRLPSSAAALEKALAFAAPPQRAVLEPLSRFLRTGEPQPFREAQLAWLEAAGPVDFFAGFFDRSADPRARKAIFSAFTGLRDAERTPLLESVARLAAGLEEKLPRPSGAPPARHAAAAEALILASAAGSLLPLRWWAVTLPIDRDGASKSALFAAAQDAAARLRIDPLLRLLADPAAGPDLSSCLPALRFAFSALREIAGRRLPVPRQEAEPLHDGALEEAHADLTAHLLSQDPLLAQSGLLAPACQRTWPQFAAASWLAALANVPAGDRLEEDRARAAQLQIWWFTAKGALLERRDGARHFFAVPDAARFRSAATDLLRLLDDIAAAADGARLSDLLERHASRVDARWRDEISARQRAAGLPRRVALLPPQLRLVEGSAPDAQAVPLDDLDAEILREWQDL